MNIPQVITKAQSLGVSLGLSNKNTIQFKGDGSSIEELMPLLKAHKSDLIQWFVFNRLYDHLAPLNGWGCEDYETWSNDLLEQPSLTMECLKALKRSWDSGSYGSMNQSDWKESKANALVT